MRYRKKPVEIDAVRIPAPAEIDERMALEQFVGTDIVKVFWRGEGLIVRTLEGEMYGAPGDMLIRGVQGELYPCKPSIFAATYEPVEGTALKMLRTGR